MTPLSWDGTPWVMVAMRSGLTFSAKFTVFSVDSKISYKTSPYEKVVMKHLPVMVPSLIPRSWVLWYLLMVGSA